MYFHAKIAFLLAFYNDICFLFFAWSDTYQLTIIGDVDI